MVHAVAAYLKNRTDLVTAAVYNVRSGETYLYDANVHETTASMVKVDILAALLHEAQEGRRELTVRKDLLATKMIEFSNNGATNQLWTDIGGRDAIDSFNTLIGFRQTFPNYSWGDIETTPRDQLQLLKVIFLPNAILSAASRKYESDLMEDVTPGQRFGLGWGSPAKATVGLKDGWYLNKGSGWQINTSGYVRYNGRLYLATIMCTNNPFETYGEGTVTTLSRLIWQNLKL
jgi:beta-lactamase class A